MEKLFKNILRAKVYDVAHQTSLDFASRLSKRLSNQIYLKREDLQPVFSFKLRGAYNKMAHLDENQRKQGVIAASAGNHAQGVALSAKKMGCKAVIYMPVSTPEIKIKAVKDLGADVVLAGDSFQDAEALALKESKKRKLTFIHPYDDWDVIAGQGTVAQEILQQSSVLPDAVFVCCGGGGLLSGVGAYIKSLYPQIKVIGVEPEEAASMTESLKAGRIVVLDEVGTFADGAAVKKVGTHCFKVCQSVVDDMITVSTDEICAAIKDVFEDTRTILEPAGALSLAGLTKYVESKNLKGKNLVAIASGANMNFHRLRHVSERAELGEEREAIVAVTIPEKPGSFKKLISLLGKRHITEFNYRLADPKKAHVFMGIQTKDAEEVKSILSRLKASGFAATDLSRDELSKLHLRHMVGGVYPGTKNEILYRFQFPERVGALSNFLAALAPEWNISLFHYRNHGTDYGRVLVGLEVSENERASFERSIKKLGYPFWDETGNQAVKLFLA